MTNLDNPSNKYAKQEVERKFLLKKIPDHSVFHLKITDYYIKDSTLRLRKTEDKRGVNYKLGQKFRINKSSPMRIMHTSLYLSKYEYDLLSSLPSNTIEKTRLHYKLNQYTMAIDAFEGSLKGLIIGEVDFGPENDPYDFKPPEFAVLEVTEDERFTGGSLASADPDKLKVLLSDLYN